MSNIIDFNNKNKYDFVIIKQRYKILNAFNEIVNFIKNNKIPLFSLSSMEIIFNKFINIKNPIIVITNQKNEFFLEFFKYIYKNFKLFYTINKNKGIYTYYLELQPVLIIYFSNKINNFKLYYKDNLLLLILSSDSPISIINILYLSILLIFSLILSKLKKNSLIILLKIILKNLS